MKRIKSACLLQTIHFQLKEDLDHTTAVQMVREELNQGQLFYPSFRHLTCIIHAVRFPM